MKPAIRVSQFLDDQHIHFEAMVHPPAYCAQRLAKHLHIPGRQVAKSVVLVGPKQYYLAVLPATHQVDLAAVARVLGVAVRLADEDEIAELFNDCERGSLTPFGRLYGLCTLLDDSFAPSSQLIFEVQRHYLAIRMRCQDFEMVEQPRRFSFAV